MEWGQLSCAAVAVPQHMGMHATQTAAHREANISVLIPGKSVSACVRTNAYHLPLPLPPTQCFFSFCIALKPGGQHYCIFPYFIL